MAMGWTVAATFAFASGVQALELGSALGAVGGFVGTITCAFVAISYAIGGHRA